MLGLLVDDGLALQRLGKTLVDIQTQAGMCHLTAAEPDAHLELVTLLQKIRDHFGKSVTITSAYRTAAHNKAVKGATYSQHCYGKAADIRVQGVGVEAVAAYAETLLPNRGGIGRYPVKAGRPAGWVHIDTRAAKSRWVS